ncbi:MAG: SufE family protein [Chitinispirillaceae bacterium]
MDIGQIQDQIIREFSALEDWMDRYEYLVHLGKNHTASDDSLKTDRNALEGCQSQVWITSELKKNRVLFKADSDSMITRGILNLLLQVLNDRPAEEIASADLYFIEKIGLRTGLSPSRANGLSNIIRRLRNEGEAWTKKSGK